MVEMLPEEVLSEVFSVLRHPIRRRILSLVEGSPKSYSKLLRDLGFRESAYLAYHLNLLTDTGLISNHDGLYSITDFGKACLNLAGRVEKKMINQKLLSHLRWEKRIFRGFAVASAILLACLSIVFAVELGKFHWIFSSIAFSFAYTLTMLFLGKHRGKQYYEVYRENMPLLLLFIFAEVLCVTIFVSLIFEILG